MVFSKSLDEIGEGYVCKYMLYIFNTPITTFKERQRKQRDDTQPFLLFSFGHCVVCSSSTYELPIKYF
jgi:hypothetical protein